MLPACVGLLCRQFGEMTLVCMEVEAWLLRSITEGTGVAGDWGMIGGWRGRACGWCWLWWCWDGLEGMPFSDRNSSRSMYSSWKVSPS